MTTAHPVRRASARRRDRRGRGLRGPRYPAELPAYRSRAERFDGLVLAALDPIDERWGDELAELELAVDEVPEIRATSPEGLLWGPEVVEDRGVPLAQLVPAGVDGAGLPTRARIVLYRRPLEARARDREDLVELLHEVLLEQVAEFLGIEPDTLDE